MCALDTVFLPVNLKIRAQRKFSVSIRGACFFLMFFTAFPSFALEKWTNSIGMEFVRIPPQVFQRGCKEYNSKHNGCSQHRNSIRISSFWISVHEVTQAQWEAVMGNNPSHFKGSNNPVDSVSWNDAQEFMRRLNFKEKHSRYRLPTQAEWQVAGCSIDAYAPNETPDAYAWYTENSGDKTHPVGQKRPNKWGLYDTYGNVAEWVQDWWDKDYYVTTNEDNPRGPMKGKARVFLGASYTIDRGDVQEVACGDLYDWFLTGLPDSVFWDVGFRVVLER